LRPLNEWPFHLQTADLSKKPQSEKPRGLKQMFSVNRQDWMEAVKSDPAHTFLVGDFRAAKILAEAKRHNQSLNSILKGDIQRGVSSDFAEMHVVPNGRHCGSKLGASPMVSSPSKPYILG